MFFPSWADHLGGKVAGLVGGLFLWGVLPLQAATSTWNGGGGPSFNWGNMNNWTSMATPASGDDIVMQGTANLTNQVDGGVWQTINSLTFSNTSGAWLIYGNTLTNGAGGITSFQSATPVTISNNWVVNAAQTWTSSSNTLNIVGAVNLGVNTLTLANNTSTVTNYIGGVISGTGGLTKSGAGAWALSGNNTFSGSTTVSGGTLSLEGAGALGATTTITLNSGGTLLLNGAGGNLINDSAAIVMAGGTLSANDKTETLGTMTMTANSTINLLADATAGTLTFANSTWVPGLNTLTINNWTGNPYVSGTDDRIFFSALMAGQTLSGIQFTGFAAGAYVLSTGEVVPVPEPGTLGGGLILLGLLARRLRRQKL